MQQNKMIIATVVCSVFLLLLIGWAFYQTLQISPGRNDESEHYPQKAVIAQAKALKLLRLDELAKSGKVEEGMTMSQVRVAFGSPVRTEQKQAEGYMQTIWWYERNGWLRLVFDKRWKLKQIGNMMSPQPHSMTEVGN
ncbi:hypothetical protein GWO43_24380 [candidate division KSB1 bacterium]|nr:hypothetical protein [candidate division KSB1 bacterium]NIR69035.1 hypothetical protein [candidate division KSB1 bacterium]NIS25603.1 hypothetical protein [candidate division KSB1 bacterium]NIT73953.1 hypothetical protein [candidate division KSB1 bacterium]NIU26280.1 hypothetical protein [candidate division KSB1 bacterium]